MNRAQFLFFGRLNDFLSRDQREQLIFVDFRERQSIKHLAESLGVPHLEIGPVQVNGQAGTLDTITQDGDRVEVYPVADSCPVEPRFVLDCHLGRLAAYLRMLGLNCLYQNDYDDKELADIAQREGRILLSRDRRLLMRKAVTYGYCLRALDPLQQLAEVMKRFDLAKHVVPFHRCPRCNHPLETVEKNDVLDQLEPLTKLYFDEFQICPDCKQIYWKGSHYERIQKMMEQLLTDT